MLVFSLLLSSFMWGVLKLSRYYSDYLQYRVEIVSNIEGRSNSAQSIDVLLVGAKASGYTIRQNRKNNGALLTLGEIDSKYIHAYPQQEDLFYVIPDDIRQQVQDALGKDITVLSLTADTLFFKFARHSNRKVPVKFTSVITYKEQFMPLSPISLKPDSVLVYGNDELIGRIDEVSAYPIKVKGVSSTLSGVVELIKMDGIRFSHNEVFYTQEVGRYVEKTIMVPVTISDAPSYANVAIVPQQVELRFREPFGNQTRYGLTDFQVSVSYDQILRNDVVKPEIVKMPQEILSVKMDPVFVECVL